MVPNDHSALISIREPGEKIQLNDNWKHLCIAEFVDYDIDELKSIGQAQLADQFHLIDENDARKIIGFVQSLPKGIDNITVHCKRGKSRSAAVAMFLGDLYSQPVHAYNPNQQVYRTLHAVYQGMKK